MTNFDKTVHAFLLTVQLSVCLIVLVLMCLGYPK
ncbi:hypothetical protein SAMN05443245_5850 [Paraburkholderia fungorum]|uniref:Uncharacterized protein n=1 Tax=Paraburkholderia fungorum TaxID=134537 RepID=A0A1H1IXQ8_9BURK|nr:hypothetical protein SAMN05443245_5850 [Paraburkholderia fungorum]